MDIRDEDDDTQGTMGDLTYTPMYTYVYEYRYRPPPAYSEVRLIIIIKFVWKVYKKIRIGLNSVHHYLSGNICPISVAKGVFVRINRNR